MMDRSQKLDNVRSSRWFSNDHSPVLTNSPPSRLRQRQSMMITRDVALYDNQPLRLSSKNRTNLRQIKGSIFTIPIDRID